MYALTCSVSSGNYYSLSKRMMPLHRRSPQGVRISSSTTCGCKIFPATGRDCSPSLAVSSPTNPKEGRTTTRLSIDPARQSFRSETLQDQDIGSKGKRYVMNVITKLQHMISSQQAMLHIDVAVCQSHATVRFSNLKSKTLSRYFSHYVY